MKKEETDLIHRCGKRNAFKVPEGYFEDFAGQLMDKLPEKYVEEFDASYQKAANRLVREFTQEFCFEDGRIDWEKLVEFNSGN